MSASSRSTLVKICGIRDRRAAEAAADAGADALGFVFADSPRRVRPEEARGISADLPRHIARIAVFRLADAEDIGRCLALFPADFVQVEPTARLVATNLGARLLPVLHDDAGLAGREALLPADRPVLFEAAGRGGRGVRPDWSVARALAARRPVWLAGGLTARNVGEAIRRVRPHGVDVSSGVEVSPGRKSIESIRAFVAAVRAADSPARDDPGAENPETTEEVA